VTLTLSVKERMTGDSIEFRKLFPRFGESPFAWTKVPEIELDCTANLSADGQALWHSRKETLMMHVLGIIHLPAGEKDIAHYLHGQVWSRAGEWAGRVNLPSYLARTGDGVLALPGHSTLQAGGPTTDKPVVKIEKAAQK
jgi:hypothetical protein